MGWGLNIQPWSKFWNWKISKCCTALTQIVFMKRHTVKLSSPPVLSCGQLLLLIIFSNLPGLWFSFLYTFWCVSLGDMISVVSLYKQTHRVLSPLHTVWQLLSLLNTLSSYMDCIVLPFKPLHSYIRVIMASLSDNLKQLAFFCSIINLFEYEPRDT